MQRMTVEYLPVDAVKPYAGNPRRNKRAVAGVAESIRRYGFVNPIVIDDCGEIICGHTRLLAAQKLHMSEVPCIHASGLTEDEIRAYRLADNKVAEKSTWDEDLLFEELSAIEMDMTVFGFESPTVKEDNFSEPPPKNPLSKRGDVWLLGRHRLMVGDATDARDVRALMDGALADALVTDPPYNVDYEGGTGKKIMNDAMSDDRFRAFLTDAFIAADAVMKPGAVFYIWHADSEGFNFREACRAAGWTVRQCLAWVKNAPVLGRQDYQWKHEPCLFGWKNGAQPLWVSDGSVPTTLLHFKKPARSADHPTMKPVLLFDKLIQTNTRMGDIVLDTFGGSGTTLIAAEQNGRIGYTMELDPGYADVIVRRYTELVGTDAEVFLLRGGQRIRRRELEAHSDG